MEKITKRAMFEALCNYAKTGEMIYFPENGDAVDVDADALLEFATHEIEQLDKKASKAKERAAAKRAEADKLTDEVRAVMSTEDFETIADIAAKVEDEDATVGKVQYRLRKLVENGEAEKQEITIPATETSKASKRQGYRLIAADQE